MNEQQSNNIRKKVLSGLFWKFGERITAQIVSLIVSILLARILDPSDYGSVALIMVFITIANVFVSYGFGSALIQKKDADNLDFSSVFYINVGISMVIYILLFLEAPYIASFYNIPVLSPALRVLSLRIPIAAINSIQQAYVSRKMLFKRFFWATLFGTVISGIVGIYMAYAGFGVWALVFQYLTNTTIDTLVLWFTVRWRPDLKCSWKRAKSLVSYGYKLLLSGLLDTGYTQLRSLIIGKMYSSSDLAYYNQGDRYPSLIVMNLNSAIGSVLFPAMSRYQDDSAQIKQMTRRAIQISSFVLWPIMIGFCVVAPTVISLLLTDKWLPCVPYIRIFCFSYGLWPIHTSNLQALNAMGKSGLFLKLEIIKKIIGILFLVCALKYGPLAIAFSLIITGIISTFVNATPNVKLLNYTYREQLKDMVSSLVLTLIMVIFIWPLCLIISNKLILLMLQIVLGAFIYIISSILTKQSSFYYLLGYIKKRRN